MTDPLQPRGRALPAAALLCLLPIFSGCSPPAPPVEPATLHPDAPPETAHWGQLAGDWDCILESAGADGSVSRSRATWSWSYLIGGHAVGDTYTGYDADGNATFHGSGVRAYNPAAGIWEIAWVASRGQGDRITRFEATSTEREITMARVPHDPTWRTVFHNIGPDRFDWRSEPSGASMECRRRRP